MRGHRGAGLTGTCSADSTNAFNAGIHREPADVGIHAAGLFDEHAAVGRQCHVVTENVAQCTEPTATGVVGLIDLGELQWVAEQNQIARGARGCQRVGLPGWGLGSRAAVRRRRTTPCACRHPTPTCAG